MGAAGGAGQGGARALFTSQGAVASKDQGVNGEAARVVTRDRWILAILEES